jgi:hypothetical protein
VRVSSRRTTSATTSGVRRHARSRRVLRSRALVARRRNRDGLFTIHFCSTVLHRQGLRY